jgi:hypothetical protein
MATNTGVFIFLTLFENGTLRLTVFDVDLGLAIAAVQIILKIYLLI